MVVSTFSFSLDRCNEMRDVFTLCGFIFAKSLLIFDNDTYLR